MITVCRLSVVSVHQIIPLQKFETNQTSGSKDYLTSPHDVIFHVRHYSQDTHYSLCNT